MWWLIVGLVLTPVLMVVVVLDYRAQRDRLAREDDTDPLGTWILGL